MAMVLKMEAGVEVKIEKLPRDRNKEQLLI
jgi:hypothetical protein